MYAWWLPARGVVSLQTLSHISHDVLYSSCLNDINIIYKVPGARYRSKERHKQQRVHAVILPEGNDK